MEIVMEDQIVHGDKEQVALFDADLVRKLHKKERRLTARLEDAQEAEARAQDRFQRAQGRLQRRRARLERLTNNLLLVQKQIADAHVSDQQPVQEVISPSETELETPLSEAEVVAVPGSEALSSSHAESMIAGTSVPEQEAVSISTDLSDGLAASGGKQGVDEWGHPTPRQGTSSPAPLVSTSVEAAPTSADLSHTFSASGGEQGYPTLQQETSALASITSEAGEAAPTNTGLSQILDVSDGEQGGNERGYLTPVQGTSIPAPLTSESVEAIPAEAGSSQVLAASGDEQREDEQGHITPGQETLAPAPLQSSFLETTLESEGSSSSSIEPIAPTTIEQEPAASADSKAVEAEVDATPEVDTSPDSSMEREPTKPLRLEQEDRPAAASLSPDIQSAKEAWVAAESAVQHARNTAHGIAASISFLSQTSGFSDKFMSELVYKQAEANKALVKAQDASRLAYERFVQAQEHVASQPADVPVDGSEDQAQRKQENGALPVVEDNANDQTVSMHAIRLYKAW